MAESWYDYGGDPAAEQRWEQWSAMPELPARGDNRAFDGWLDSKGLSREDLLRTGARWGSLHGEPAIVYLFPDGLKWRSLSGKRLSESGVTWNRSKIIPSSEGKASSVIIAEGETDGAYLSRIAPDMDVAILPAGAKHVPEGDDFSKYSRVYVATDADDAGEEGAQRLLLRHAGSIRVLPPNGANDWCDSGAVSFSERVEVAPPRLTFSVADIVATDFGSYEANNWFAQGIAPIAGEIIVHGKMKSLKSVVVMELGRAIATGTSFADYVPFIRESGPGRVLLFQYEIPPPDFQRRLLGMGRVMDPEAWELFTQNFGVFAVGDGRLPRLKAQEPSFRSTIVRAAEEFEAEVLIFDPVQKMLGSINADKSHELEPVLDLFDELKRAGFTVIYSHHNNKAERNSADPYSMSGSQRFGADADSICSVYYDAKNMIDDHNPMGMKQRNFAWELRNGFCQPRSITATPDVSDPDFMHVTYDEPITAAPVITSSAPAPVTSIPGVTPPPIT